MKRSANSNFFGNISAVLSLFVVLLFSAPASGSVWTYACGGDPLEPKSVFDKNEFICAAGTGIGGWPVASGCGIFPCGDIYVMTNRSWSGGEALADAMGSDNRVWAEMGGGGFGLLDNVIIIATPAKSFVGEFDLILDNNLNQKFDAGDEVNDFGQGFAFKIVDLGHPPVDATQIKSAALAMSKGASDAIDIWNAGCNALDALGVAMSLMSGDVFGAAIGVLGNVTGIATDYNGAVIAKATDLIGGFDPNSNPQKASGIYGNMAKHWYDLYEDPPDANFTDLAPLSFAAINAELAASSVVEAYPFQVKGTDSREAALIRIANRSVEQAALVLALRQSFEKYQGAAAVSNYEFAFRQLEQTRLYGTLLAGNLSAFKSDLQSLKGVLAAQGQANKVYSVSEMQALKARVTGSGLSAEEILSLKGAGFSDARITLLAQYIKAINVPAADFSMASSIDALIAQVDSAVPSIQSFNADLLAAMYNLLPEFTPHHPVADAGGPYSGLTGSQITLDGGGSTDPDVGDLLTYAWDLNGDSAFDDAAGKTVLFTGNKRFSGLVGLKVTDPAGNSAIDYAQVFISVGNLPPVITGFLPGELNPKASVLNPLGFSVTASDPEGGALSYDWSVDGVAAGTGTSFTLAPQANLKGTRRVMVTVRDNQPDNPAAVEGRLVSIYLDCDPSDPATMTSYYRDQDGDGFGDPGQTTLACSAGAGYVANSFDCDDSDAGTGKATLRFYRDADGDGLGDAGSSLIACSAPAGFVANGLDCGDANSGIGAASQTFYRDFDGDGFGDAGSSQLACSAPAGYVVNSLDCNDSNPAIVDTLTTYYLDVDGDGFGDSSNSVQACLQPAGYVATGLDCDDANPFVNPGQKEIVHNGKDDDCNATTLDNWSKSFVVAIDDASWVYYARSNGDGTFSNYAKTEHYLGGGTSRGIVQEDFNGDGYLDFIAGRGNGSFYLFTNNGNDKFTFNGIAGTHPNPGGYAMDMTAGDFNNDGVMDFAANGNTNVTAIFLSDGQGGFTRTTLTLPYTGRGLDVADFNHDGNIDLAVSFYGTNDAWVYKGDGSGNFTGAKAGTATTSGGDNYALSAADFDNDGNADIIVSGSSNGDAYLIRGKDDGTFDAAVLVPTLDMGSHSSMDAYDLNNDGNPDVVLGDYYGYKMWFYPGNGDGTFAARSLISISNTGSALLGIAAPPAPNPASFPVADAHPKVQAVDAGDSVSFTGAHSIDPARIASYSWDFGDSTSATGATVDHLFASEGRFFPKLSVTDLQGRTDRASVRVTVKGNLPVADAGGPYPLFESDASNGRFVARLDGSASSDDSAIVKYEWLLGDKFIDNFDDGNANGWTPSAGTWSVNGGAYEQTNASPDRTDTLTGDANLGDYTVEADVMLVSGTGQEAMLLFRAVNASNHYEFIFRGRGINDLLLYRQVNGSHAQLAQSNLPFTPQLNTWYRLKVEAYKGNIKCYVNDALYIDHNDATFAKGMVGLSTYRCAAKFENFNHYAVRTGVNPEFLIPEGTFPTTLTVTDKAGQTATAATQVTATKGTPPVADVGGPYLFGEELANQNRWTVMLDGSGSTDDTAIETYAWTFGDGGTGSGAQPSHVYTGAGSYNVILTVTDHVGLTSTASTTVTAKGNLAPVAGHNGPYSVTEDQVVNKHWTINADAAASTDDLGIWTYSWNFGDGSAAVATKAATHTYANAGTYSVTLKVTDHANQSQTVATTASVVATAAPTASAGGPYATEPTTPVVFDGSASTDNTGILSYSWDFGDGTAGKGAQPSHAYGEAGNYTVTLTVKDTALQTATASSTVTVAVGSPPVANAGGPYATNVAVPIRLNGSGSTDDHGIALYRWTVGTPSFLLEESFAGTVIDPAKWLFPAAGVTQNDAVTLTGSAGWGSRYLFSKDNYALDGTAVLLGQVKQTSAGNLMFGFKNTSSNYAYNEMPYALYFASGTIYVYENGSSRGTFGSYSNNVLYDVKIEVVGSSTAGTVGGARYYLKPATDQGWTLVYSSGMSTSSTLKVGASYYSGTFMLDNVSLSSGSWVLEGEKPVFVADRSGTFPVQLTVTDGAGQSGTASSALTVSGDPLVITAPWQFTGGAEVPHDTWSGEEVILKAVVKAGKAPMTYVWDFGDGTSSAPATVTNSYNLSAKHTYSAAEGTPIAAQITVTDADGKSSSDSFPIIVRQKALNVEVNKAIDDALWYIHTTQNRANGSWQSSGWTAGYYASPTASAIHSMEINGHLEVGDFSNDPYVEDVWRGMGYILSSLEKTAISDQAYGDPDGNGNGIGIQVNSGSVVYEGGQLMMAMVASGTPNMKAVNGGSGIVGRTYREIVEDMAEMYYWGQGDDAWGYGAGGWRYGWQGQADNSASQWAALGFEAAEEQGWIAVPKWVRDRNEVWLAYSRSGDGRGYGYTGPGNDVATTPSGLAQVAFNKIPTSDPRWKQVEDFVASYWSSWYNGTGNYYALYAMAKAMRTAKPKEVSILGEGTANAIDWYNDPTRGVARMIVNQQDANGMFTGGGGTKWVEGPFRAAWGVIILTKTLFVLPPVAVAGNNMVWGIDWPLNLDGSKSYHLDPFRKIVKYEWDVDGDGVYDYSSDTPAVTHTYSELGTYKVTLRVTDNNEPAKYDSNSITIIVAVPPHPPVADPGGPYQGHVGIPLQLDGSKSYDIDPTDIITSYGWEVDGVFPYNFADATGAKPTYTWNTPGTYNIGLKVVDNGVLSPNNDKLSDTKWSTIIIRANSPPSAEAGGPYTVDEGGIVQLDGSGSSDPDGNAIGYAWDLDNDGIFESSGQKPSFSRPDNGAFTVGLRVSDGALESTATATVTVLNQAPAVDQLPPATINEGGIYTAAGSFTDPGADGWTATVDYGDGTGVQPLTLSGKTFSLGHLYPQNGFYTVTVTVADDDGGAGSGSTQVTVNNVAPMVNAGPDVVLDDTRVFTSAGWFTDPGADTWTATVNYGDGTGEQPLALNPDKSFALSHQYSTNGSFTVTVSVRDSDAATGSDTALVVAGNKPPQVAAGPDGNIPEGSSFTSGGSFSDPSSASWTATVDYGDGTGGEPLSLNPDRSFDLNHIYSKDGTYTVTVTVTDDEGATAGDTAVVTVGNVAPTVNAGPDAAISAGGTFTSTGSFADPGDDVWAATVDYGDGTGVQALALNADKTFDLSHSYPLTGTYTVAVTVQDNSGAAGSDSALVTANTSSCLTTLTARAKTGMVQLNWSASEHTPTTQYDIYRSTQGPSTGFTRIRTGYTNTYPVFVNSGLTNGTTYYYRVEKSLAPAAGYCSSKVVSGKPGSLF